MQPLRRSCLLVAVLAIPSLAPAQRPATPPCRRPAAKQFAPGAVVAINGVATPPCQILVQATGVVLRADPEGKISNILRSVARDSRGRYYTSAGFGEVTVWGPDGKVLQTFGRLGSGPGEFKRGLLAMSVDPADNLYIRDNGLRWQVFSPDYKHLRETKANGMGLRPEASAWTAPFTLLTSELPSGLVGHDFAIYDFSGKPASGVPVFARGGAGTESTPPFVRGFGARSPTARSHSFRQISTPVDGAFWAGPLDESGAGYVLQLIGLDGTVRRTIRRTVPWFKPGSDAPPPLPTEEVPEERFELAPLPTAIVSVRHDGHGLLYVMTRVTSSRWGPAIGKEKDREAQEAMIYKALDIYLEVIDVDAGLVLASSGPIPANQALLTVVQGWFNAGWSGYRITEDADGIPSVVMLEMSLRGK
jgi:hypothetical protein